MSNKGIILLGLLCLILSSSLQINAQGDRAYPNGITVYHNGELRVYSEMYTSNHHQYVSVKFEDKWGCLDTERNPITEIKYDNRVHLNRIFPKRTQNLLDKLAPNNLSPISIDQKKWQFDARYLLVENTMPNEISPTLDFEEDHFSIVSVNNKYGVIDALGKEIIPLVYDQLSSFKNHFSCAKKGNKYGVINIKNETVVAFEYDQLHFVRDSLIVSENPTQLLFSYGKKTFDYLGDPSEVLVVARKGNKYGLLNFQKNNWVFDIKYDKIHLTEHNDRFIVSKDQKSGVYSKEGEELIAPIYKRILPVDNQYYVYDEQNNQGLLDDQGEIIIPIQYQHISKTACDYFLITKEGQSLKAIASPKGQLLTGYSYTAITGCNDTHISVLQDSISALLDAVGNIILPLDPSAKSISVNNDIVVVGTSGKKVKLGVYFIRSEKSLEVVYDRIAYSPHGVYLYKDAKNRLVGFTLTDGTPLLDVKYQSIKQQGDWFWAKESFEDQTTKMTIVSPIHRKKVYTINQKKPYSYQLRGPKNKKIVKSAEYIGRYRPDPTKVLLVITQKGKSGIIDRKGKVVVPIKYDKIYQDKMAYNHRDVYFAQNEGVYYILKENEQIKLPGVTKIKDASSHYRKPIKPDVPYYFRISKDSGEGIIDQNGKEILPCEYKAVWHRTPHHPVFQFSKDNQIGIVDTNKTILDPVYNHINPVVKKSNNELLGYIVSQDGKFGLMSKEGKQIIPLRFEALSYNVDTEKYGPIFNGKINGFQNFYRMDGTILNL